MAGNCCNTCKCPSINPDKGVSLAYMGPGGCLYCTRIDLAGVADVRWASIFTASITFQKTGSTSGLGLECSNHPDTFTIDISASWTSNDPGFQSGVPFPPSFNGILTIANDDVSALNASAGIFSVSVIPTGKSFVDPLTQATTAKVLINFLAHMIRTDPSDDAATYDYSYSGLGQAGPLSTADLSDCCASAVCGVGVNTLNLKATPRSDADNVAMTVVWRKTLAPGEPDCNGRIWSTVDPFVLANEASYVITEVSGTYSTTMIGTNHVCNKKMETKRCCEFCDKNLKNKDGCPGGGCPDSNGDCADPPALGDGGGCATEDPTSGTWCGGSIAELIANKKCPKCCGFKKSQPSTSSQASSSFQHSSSGTPSSSHQASSHQASSVHSSTHSSHQASSHAVSSATHASSSHHATSHTASSSHAVSSHHASSAHHSSHHVSSHLSSHGVSSVVSSHAATSGTIATISSFNSCDAPMTTSSEPETLLGVDVSPSLVIIGEPTLPFYKNLSDFDYAHQDICVGCPPGGASTEATLSNHQDTIDTVTGAVIARRSLGGGTPCMVWMQKIESVLCENGSYFGGTSSTLMMPVSVPETAIQTADFSSGAGDCATMAAYPDASSGASGGIPCANAFVEIVVDAISLQFQTPGDGTPNYWLLQLGAFAYRRYHSNHRGFYFPHNLYPSVSDCTTSNPYYIVGPVLIR